MSSDILSEVEQFRTLGDAMEWAFARQPAAELFTVIAQDEYTHDVVIRVSDDVFLNFDTT
ncbi:MAG: hypothetical protein L0229_15355 [Blastocatellia bacterium]|nr:hypothetical protein [Blastocatellia bacterium]